MEVNELLQEMADFFSKLGNVCMSFRFKDFLDICFVAFLIYSVIKILRETRAFQLVKGILIFGIVYMIINIFNMQASTYITNMVMSNIIVVLIIIFQPELRHTLETTGRSGLSKLKDQFLSSKNTGADEKVIKDMIKSFASACEHMSNDKVGSLTVFERSTLLGEVISNGTIVDASATSQMFCNIFYPKAPLHDGAAIVRKGRIYAAGCILTLTKKNNDVDKNLGTRHRAAIGMSEESDAIVVVTSEETGTISVAYNGNLKRDFDKEKIIEILNNYLVEHKYSEDEKPLFAKFFERIMKVKGGSGKK
ncbi:MAG: diadenylate cyclase CdaA [Clostridia bacterium]|nr:diadenylate cyclase CdaA [Clostridia bacterium]